MSGLRRWHSNKLVRSCCVGCLIFYHRSPRSLKWIISLLYTISRGAIRTLRLYKKPEINLRRRICSYGDLTCRLHSTETCNVGQMLSHTRHKEDNAHEGKTSQTDRASAGHTQYVRVTLPIWTKIAKFINAICIRRHRRGTPLEFRKDVQYRES